MLPRLLPLVLLAILLLGCSLPDLERRSPSSAIAPELAAQTALGRALAPALAAQPAGHSGIHTLRDPLDAFAARVLLARAAERSLDLQYYIWNPDVTGQLLLGELLAAAERGVRVRLLLDDNGIGGLDASLALLDAHPQVEVRIFNPLLPRRAKWLAFLYDFGRANRRMHNKSFTADGSASIVGGRNVGDEYFGAPDPLQLMDLDVLGIGPVAGAVAADFDRYWASASAYPLELLLDVPGSESGERPWQALARRVQVLSQEESASSYLASLADRPLLAELNAGRLDFTWAPVRLLSDDPAKGLGQAPPEALLTVDLLETLGAATTRLDLVSAYFVPGEEGSAALAEMAARGVQVRALTNSYAATDVGLVHAGYAKRRRALLEAGVALYEARPWPGSADPPDAGGMAGSSAASLHAKSFAVDGRLLFIGSFNFDPRSANLNTELGFLIDSPELASLVHQTLDELLPGDDAWELRLDGEGELRWRDGRGDESRREPGIGRLEALWLGLLARLPIDWLL